jgi:formylglycine-generating enzyme required for sulfatase activity
VNGQDCKGRIFARSVPGVAPRVNITWVQAQQALANSGKRLPTNAEWQMVVAGTPDSTACNVSTGAVASTGANAGCVSSWGANDMVGNLWEWVADWDEQADGCASWPAGYGSDSTCFGDGTPSRRPGAFFRGGGFGEGSDAGPFAVNAAGQPSDSSATSGSAAR